MLGLGAARRRRLGDGVGLEVEQVHHELGARRAVDGGVVHLGDDADAVVLESLDHPDLPQRALAVERTAGDLAGDLGRARGGCPGPGAPMRRMW